MRRREHGAAGVQHHHHQQHGTACWLAWQREEKRLPGWPTAHLLAAAQVPFAALLHAAGQCARAAHNLRHMASVSLLAARLHFVRAGLPGKERQDRRRRCTYRMRPCSMTCFSIMHEGSHAPRPQHTVHAAARAHCTERGMQTCPRARPCSPSDMAHLAAHVHVAPLDLLLLLQQPHSRLVRQRADARLPHAGVALAQRRQAEVLALHCGQGGGWGRASIVREAGKRGRMTQRSGSTGMGAADMRKLHEASAKNPFRVHGGASPRQPSQAQPSPPERGGAEKILSRQRLSHSSW